MIELTLNHEKSPVKLRQLNDSLVTFLNSVEVDETRLLDLVNERQSYVESYLAELTEPSKKEFAALEYEVNESLVKHIKHLSIQAKTSTANFMKAQKAVKQYR